MAAEGALVDIAPWFRTPNAGYGIVDGVTPRLMTVVFEGENRVVMIANDPFNYNVVTMPKIDSFTRKQFLCSLNTALEIASRY